MTLFRLRVITFFAISYLTTTLLFLLDHKCVFSLCLSVSKYKQIVYVENMTFSISIFCGDKRFIYRLENQTRPRTQSHQFVNRPLTNMKYSIVLLLLGLAFVAQAKNLAFVSL